MAEYEKVTLAWAYASDKYGDQSVEFKNTQEFRDALAKVPDGAYLAMKKIKEPKKATHYLQANYKIEDKPPEETPVRAF
jgi:hypothetical protein